MNFQQPIRTFEQLGLFFKQALTTDTPEFYQAYLANNWFTEEYVKKAIQSWSDELTVSKLTDWLSVYMNISEPTPKKVVIIMAGNIPLVGLHDLLAVLASGHHALVKLSSDDTVLMKWVIDALLNIDPSLQERITLINERLPKEFDAVIATGSNNTNRYFEHYFKGKPSILRKSRTSLAVLSGNETPEDLHKLGEDIFTYFGLGCRNVSKLLLPEGYDLGTFYEGIAGFYEHINHNKYANNYTYHKAILLMNLTQHLDNNFLLVKEDTQQSSPLGVLYYQFYKDPKEVSTYIEQHKDELQCVVSKQPIVNSEPFGSAQKPAISDYADGVDTLSFLLQL